MRRIGGGSQPDVGLILSDRVKLIGIGVANGAVALVVLLAVVVYMVTDNVVIAKAYIGPLKASEKR